MSSTDNGRENGASPEGPRVDALGLLVLLGIALFIVFFGSLALMGLAAGAGAAGAGGVESVLGFLADAGLLVSLALAAALLVGVLVWFTGTVVRLAIRAARKEG